MVYLAKEIKEVVDVPVITAGRITTPELAEEILRQGKADLIALARPLFADPQWPKKAQTGQEASIVHCKDCGTCFRSVVADRPAICAQWDKAKMIRRKDAVKEMENPRKRVLIALDGSENATMGAAYVGDMLANSKDVFVTLLHIQTDESLKNEEGINQMMEIARSLLAHAGIPEEAINIQFRKESAGVARDILNYLAEEDYGTIVVGRRGISRTQEFLFGSVSSKIVQNTKDCTVWVVE